jgi:hypothetical protein
VFKGRHFDRSVILLCVRWYLAYNLSLRNLEEMMAERGFSSPSCLTSLGTSACSQVSASTLARAAT